MPLVRLASRAVVGVFATSNAVGVALAELEKSGIPPVEISVLGRADAVGSLASPEQSSGGWFGRRRKSRPVLRDRAEIERGGARLAGAGPLLSALQDSPNTSVVGALVMQGIPQREALVYAEFVASGKILLLVGVPDRTRGEQIRALLDQADAETASYFAGRPYGTAFHGTGPGLS